MSEEQVVAAPRRRSQAEADQLAAEFETSGLNRHEFCRKHGLNVSTLDAYRKRLRRTQPEGRGAIRCR
jgi:transposase-like protein